MAITAVSYLSSVLVLVEPDFFRSEGGTWFRIVTRALIAIVLWNLLAVLLRSQRIQTHRDGPSAPRDREDAR
jgi:cell shape-determining protein MreD